MIEEAVSLLRAQDLALDRVRGVALFDPTRDALITSLKSFDTAVSAISGVPNFIGRFGSDAATRIVLQLSYQYFKSIDTAEFNETVFEVTWRNLIEELEDSYWIFRGVANLRYFQTDRHPIELGGGVTIRGRCPDDLRSLGFEDAVWERIVDDWSGFGASSFVLVAEHAMEKEARQSDSDGQL